MPKFVYTAKDREGENIYASQEADSGRSLVSSLRQQGLTVISVSELTSKEAVGKKINLIGSKRRIKLSNVSVFCRQLTAMFDAGLSIIDSIESIAQQTENVNFRRVLNRVRDDIQGGDPFSQALAKHPKVFSSLVIALVLAGEESGKLPQVLGDLASYLEDQIALRRKVKSASAYPAFIAIFFFAALCAVVFLLIPKFQSIFSSFGAELPLLTRVVMNISSLALRNIGYEIGALFLSFLLFYAWSRTRSGRYMIDRLKLSLPIFGKLFQKVVLARFTRAFGSLLAGGVTITYSLEIVAQVSGNLLFERAIDRVRTGIIEGSSIGRELAKDPLFPPMLTKMVATGEESGTMSQMLNKSAQFYSEEVDAAVSGLTSIIEPLLIVLLGGMVGIVVIALYLPIFKMVGTVR